MGYKISVRGVDGRCAEAVSRHTGAGMRQRGCKDTEGSGEQRPYPHACGVSAVNQCQRLGEAVEGEKFADVAGGVPDAEEEVLGKAFLGSGVWRVEYRGNNGRDGTGVSGTPSGDTQWEHGELDYGVIKEFHSASFMKPLHF